MAAVHACLRERMGASAGLQAAALLLGRVTQQLLHLWVSGSSAIERRSGTDKAQHVVSLHGKRALGRQSPVPHNA
jgi:hypothetical protein